MYLVCYDIRDPKRLRRVAKTLENYGIRIQYSFFQCDMPKEILKKMTEDVLRIIHTDADRFYIYPLCEKCTRKARTDGNGSVLRLQTFEIV